MAIIQCPNCGKQISDKASKCVNCGFQLITESTKVCPECGTNVELNADVCPQCGCPLGNLEAPLPQQVEVTGVKVTSNGKKVIIAAIFLIILVLSGIFVLKESQKKSAEKAAEQYLAEYSEKYDSLIFTMLSGAADAENCGNLISKVWRNAIFKEKDSETDRFTRPGGWWVSDFNDAISKLFADSSFSNNIKTIKDNQSTVQELMKDMKTPPEEYKEAYRTLTELYDAYLQFTNLVISPTGNLQTFTSNFSDADSKVSNCYSAAALYMG